MTERDFTPFDDKNLRATNNAGENFDEPGIEYIIPGVGIIDFSVEEIKRMLEVAESGNV